jgi:hypothetical protein
MAEHNWIATAAKHNRFLGDLRRAPLVCRSPAGDRYRRRSRESRPEPSTGPCRLDGLGGGIGTVPALRAREKYVPPPPTDCRCD